jgi:hypothetical protein
MCGSGEHANMNTEGTHTRQDTGGQKGTQTEHRGGQGRPSTPHITYHAHVTALEVLGSCVIQLIDILSCSSMYLS